MSGVHNAVISPSVNKKQYAFLEAILLETEPSSRRGYRFFFYGGAIRGGKTYVCLTALVLLAKKYPNSRWHIIRNDLSNLLKTTIPSMEKLLHGANVVWHRVSSDYYIKFPNGSRIYFFQEMLPKDPDLARFKGLETNGIFLEQIEELSRKTYEKAKERVGSWKIPLLPLEANPPPIILSTFNPTNNWLKSEIYDKYAANELTVPYYYMSALPIDNPYNEAHQFEVWSLLDSKNYNRFVKGAWDYEDDKLRFAYSFSLDRHVSTVSFDHALPVYLSFDFGKSPNVCLVLQTDLQNRIRVLAELSSHGEKGLLSLLSEVISWLRSHSPLQVCITGDASGDTFSQYAVIKHVFLREKIYIYEIKKPKANPNIGMSRILLNSVLEHVDCKISAQCSGLLRDLQYTEIYMEQHTGRIGIVKQGIHSDLGSSHQQLSHYLDAFRYFVWSYFRWFIKIGDL